MERRRHTDTAVFTTRTIHFSSSQRGPIYSIRCLLRFFQATTTPPSTTCHSRCRQRTPLSDFFFFYNCHLGRPLVACQLVSGTFGVGQSLEQHGGIRQFLETCIAALLSPPDVLIPRGSVFGKSRFCRRASAFSFTETSTAGVAFGTSQQPHALTVLVDKQYYQPRNNDQSTFAAHTFHAQLQCPYIRIFAQPSFA